MPRIEITPEELIVSLSFFEKLAAAGLSIRVPLRHVRGATDDDGMRNELGMKSRGCAIPGVIHSGTFYKKGDRQFVYAKAKQHLVVVELEGEKWARLILGVADARMVAQQINAAVELQGKGIDC